MKGVPSVPQSSYNLIDRMQSAVSRISGVSDERDSIALLLEFTRLWPEVKAALAAHYPCSPQCAGYLREQKVTAALKKIARGPNIGGGGNEWASAIACEALVQ